MNDSASSAVTAPQATMMVAARVVGPGRIEMTRSAAPAPGPGEVRVAIEGCGVCASNAPPWEGRPWFAYPLAPGQLGHEAWGVVDGVGCDVKRLQPGQRVAFLSEHAYATHDVAGEAAVVPLPDELDGAPVPAEPLGCAMNIFRRSDIRAGQPVAVVGAGFIGLLLVRLGKLAGARVIAISRRQHALDAARQMGAAETVRYDDDAAVMEAVSAMTGDELCQTVIEATGKQAPLDLAARLTRQRGRLVIAGFHQDGPRQVDMQSWNWRGLDVINAHERDPAVYRRGMQEAVQLMRSGRLDPRPLFTHVYPLSRLAEALEATRTRPDGFIKALVMMQEGDAR
ncbi:MAG: zinc-binding dehydrogenase [Phycisphaeraceae bacterium]